MNYRFKGKFKHLMEQLKLEILREQQTQYIVIINFPCIGVTPIFFSAN